MDLTFWRGEHTIFPGIGEISDRSLRAHQNQLAKFLELLDPLFKHVLNAVYSRNSRPALQASKGIGSEEFCSCGCRDVPSGDQPFAVQRISGKQDCSWDARTEHGGSAFDVPSIRDRRDRQRGD